VYLRNCIFFSRRTYHSHSDFEGALVWIGGGLKAVYARKGLYQGMHQKIQQYGN
jgi:hypothetical protein